MKQYERPLLDAYKFDFLDVITQSTGQITEDKTGQYDPEVENGGWQ